MAEKLERAGVRKPVHPYVDQFYAAAETSLLNGDYSEAKECAFKAVAAATRLKDPLIIDEATTSSQILTLLADLGEVVALATRMLEEKGESDPVRAGNYVSSVLKQYDISMEKSHESIKSTFPGALSDYELKVARLKDLYLVYRKGQKG